MSDERDGAERNARQPYPVLRDVVVAGDRLGANPPRLPPAPAAAGGDLRSKLEQAIRDVFSEHSTAIVERASEATDEDPPP